MPFIHNEGPSRPAVPRDNGLSHGKNRVSEQVLERYKESFADLFESGQLTVFEDEQSEDSDEDEDQEAKKEDLDYDLSEVHHATLRADIDGGEYDDRLDEIIDCDERDSVKEAAKERKQQIG